MTRMLFAALLLLCVSAVTAAAAPTLITHATLISPERSAPVQDAWVRLEDGKISDMGTGTVASAGATVIDARERYLIPGLIDSHVHLYHATGLKGRYTKDYDSLAAAFFAQQPRSFLYFGYTSVIELNANAKTNARFEAAPQGPRLYHCGQGVVLSDGFMALELEDTPVEKVFPGYLIDHHAGGRVPEGANPAEHTPEAVVEFVQQQGGRCIKLYFEEALWWPGGAPPFRLPSAAIVRDVVAAAHARHLPVVLHATTPKAHRLAMETGVDVAAHGLWEWPGEGFATPTPSEDTAKLARDLAHSPIATQPTFRSIYNTASLFNPALLDEPAWEQVVPAAYLAYLRGDGQVQRDRFLRVFGSQFEEDPSVTDVPSALKAYTSRYERLIGNMAGDGATLIFGTDTAVGGFGWGSPPGLAGYWEMQSWQRAGVPLKTLFTALTLGNARAFGLDGEIGSIEVGKLADLLLLQSDPLADLAAYDSIDLVVQGGEVIERESLSVKALQ